MGWFFLTKQTASETRYSLARGQDDVHLTLNSSQVVAIDAPEGGALCLVRTSDGKEYEVRNDREELLRAMENPLSL